MPKQPPQPPTWQPLPEAWHRFSKAHPELYVGIAASARTRFVKRHFQALHEAGALVKTPSGTWYAHRDKFDPAAYALVLGLPVQ